MSELLDKQVNVQKESLKQLPGFTQAPASPRKKCAMKMKETKKNKRLPCKNFCGDFYKAVSEEWLNQFR